jgi:DNA-binding transcriptional regulator YiaG
MDPCLERLKKLHEVYKTGEYSKLGISIALGVNRRTVRRWFQGKYPPTKKHRKLIENLARKLQKDVSEGALY